MVLLGLWGGVGCCGLEGAWGWPCGAWGGGGGAGGCPGAGVGAGGRGEGGGRSVTGVEAGAGHSGLLEIVSVFHFRKIDAGGG